jgi:hypothetical protein
MDPYLEDHWGDVHTSLVTYARDQLRGQMPPGLRVRVEEHIAVQDENGAARGYYPDVRVYERPAASATAPAFTSVAVGEPLVVPMETEPAVERSLQIIDAESGGRIVTAIEFLSPANKVGEAGRHAYRQEQRDLIEGGVNLVEIDLLREGRYVIAAPEANVPATHRVPYRVCVVRATCPSRAEVYRTPLQEPLPTIRIPLRAADPDAALNLQTLIEQAYENGGYDDIDYRSDPDPPLAPGEAAWADGVLREKGLR